MAEKKVKVVSDQELKEIVKKDDYFTFASRLNSLLVKRGITQKELSDLTKQSKTMSQQKISQQTIGQYVHGQTDCSALNLKLLAETLNTSADYLLGRVDIDAVNVSKASICKETGLTPAALERIIQIQERYTTAPLEKLLFSKEFETILSIIEMLTSSRENELFEHMYRIIPKRTVGNTVTDNSFSLQEIPWQTFWDTLCGRIQTEFTLFLDGLRKEIAPPADGSAKEGE